MKHVIDAVDVVENNTSVLLQNNTFHFRNDVVVLDCILYADNCSNTAGSLPLRNTKRFM
jgi:hypothetical protein